jgi:hypothetical protein
MVCAHKQEHPFHFRFPLRSTSNCLRLLPRLPFASLLPSILSSTTCFKRQFLHNMWPIKWAFLLFVSTIFLISLTPCQCFPTFVRPRPGKLFFYKTRARGPTNLLVNTFPIFLSSYINTLRTGDANLRFLRSCITTVKDGWRKFAFFVFLHYNSERRMTQICVFCVFALQQ